MADPEPLLPNAGPPNEDPPDEDTQLGINYVGDLRDTFIQDEVLTKARALHENGQKVTNFHFSGRAIEAVWPVTLIQWSFAVIFPFFVVYVSVCPQPWEPFAHYPAWVLGPFGVVIAFSLRREYLALKWTLCTVLQHCAPFNFMRFELSFKMWLFFITGLSLTTHFDLATNGLFLAKIMKTVRCQGGEAEKIGVIWRKTIEAAPIVSWIPGFGHLDMLILGGWLLMFLQPMIGFAFACPLRNCPLRRKEDRVSYEMESEKDGYKTPWSSLFYPGGVLHHADALQTLATVNRMVSLTDKSLKWCVCRGEDLLAGTQGNRYTRTMEQLTKEFARITHRLILVNVLEKAYMLEVQVTVFCISRCLMPRDQPWWARLDGQMLGSLFLSGATFMKVVYDSIEQLSAVNRFSDRILGEMENHPDLLQNEEQRNKVRVAKKRLRFCKVGFGLGVTGLVVIMLHSLSKFVMAFACEDSLWNIRSPFSPPPPGLDWKGCVDLSTYLGDR